METGELGGNESTKRVVHKLIDFLSTCVTQYREEATGVSTLETKLAEFRKGGSCPTCGANYAHVTRHATNTRGIRAQYLVRKHLTSHITTGYE